MQAVDDSVAIGRLSAHVLGLHVTAYTPWLWWIF